MKILLIGASGFIGRRVSAHLRALGVEVTEASRSGTDKGFTQLNLADSSSLKSILVTSHYDWVVNLAGAGMTHGRHSSQEMEVANFSGPLALASTVASLRDPPAILHAASAIEANSRSETSSEYARTKAAGTLGLAKALRGFGVPHVVVRLHNVYGPGQPRGRFVRDAVDAAIADREFVIQQPHRIRDFCYVEDVATRISECVMLPVHRRYIEIGTGTGVSLLSATRMIYGILGTSCVRILVNPARDNTSGQENDVANASRPGFVKCGTAFSDGVKLMVEGLR